MCRFRLAPFGPAYRAGLILALTAFGSIPLLITPVLATPIPGGSDLIENFDFSSAPFAPPFQTINIAIGLSLAAGSDNVVQDFYGSLNGGNFLGFQSASFTLASAGTSPFLFNCSGTSPAFCPNLLDGAFSVGLHTTSGSADLTSANATATVSETVTPLTMVTAIPTGNANNDVIVNFLFPAATYQMVNIAFGLSLAAGSDDVVEDFYGSVNGSDFLGFQSASFTLASTGTSPFLFNCSGISPAFCPGLLDGAFSVGFHMTSGSADLTSANASAETTESIAGVLATTTSVPEPSTGTLFAVGLGAIAVCSRGRRRVFSRRAN